MKIKSDNIDRICKYCEHSTEISVSEEVLCSKKGVVSPDYICRKFIYDPFKRIPRRPSLDTSSFEYITLDGKSDTQKA